MEKQKGAVSAIIVAAGRGTRMGLGFNKVLAPLGGVPVLCRTLKPFLAHEEIGQVLVVISKEDEQAVKGILEAHGLLDGVRLVWGGATRQESVCNGLSQVMPDAGIILIHDGARPFVDDDIIGRSIEAARRHGAACAGMPVADTIKRVDPSGVIVETPDRKTLWAAQTPQSFQTGLIRKAHAWALEHGVEGTDDAMLVEAMGVAVIMFSGSSRNLKMTSPEDVRLAESLLDP